MLLFNKWNGSIKFTGDFHSRYLNETIVCVCVFPCPLHINFIQDLKVPGRGNKPLRTTIKEHSPWKLKQVSQSLLLGHDKMNGSAN